MSERGRKFLCFGVAALLGAALGLADWPLTTELIVGSVLMVVLCPAALLYIFQPWNTDAR